MRILLLACVALVVTTSAARADERRTTLWLGAIFGAQNREQLVVDDFGGHDQLGKGFGGPRLTLSWEDAPLPYPAARGYAVDAGLVPELIAGAFLDDDKGEGMIGLGLRGELRLSQREMGLLRVSMRGVFYVTARALVVGEQRELFGELVLGEYILVGRTGRIGFEVGGMSRREGAMTQAHSGIIGQLYLGWQL